MAAIFDQASSGKNGTTTNTLSWSHVLGSLGGNGLIIVGIEGKTLPGNYANSVVSTVTFNGISMTKIKEDGNNGGGPWATHVSLWALWGSSIPAAGTYTILATYTGNTVSQTGGGMSFRNMKPQTAEANASNNAYVISGTGTISVSVTTLTPNALLVSVYGSQNTPSGNSATGDTREWFSQPTSGEPSESDGFFRIVAAPGSATVSINYSNPETQALCIASFAIAPGANFLPFL